MSHSSLIADHDGGVLGCQSSAGMYYLGRTYFRVNIKNTPGEENYYLGGITLERHADREHGFCLDYRGSPTSNDKFIVKKTPQSLLKQITTEAEDQSGEIARTLIQTFFVGISKNKRFPSSADIGKSTRTARVSSTTVFDGVYDPYRDGETALLNDAINDFGFCLVMEDQQFYGGQTTINSYCDHPLRGDKRERAMVRSHQRTGPQPSVHDDRGGIFYRPRRTRTVYLYIKQDLRRRGGWKLRASQAVLIENTSPIMFVGIDRTFFAKRETTIDFEDGALTDITIKKGSELVEFVSIPLYVAQSIVALPAQIIQIKIDDTNQRGELLKAQADLIDAETKLRTAQANQTAKATGNGGNGSVNGTSKGAGTIINRQPTPAKAAASLDVFQYCNRAETAEIREGCMKMSLGECQAATDEEIKDCLRAKGY